jgi:NTP pyrophosphatase (non-canonical NTP hydrolase)
MMTNLELIVRRVKDANPLTDTIIFDMLALSGEVGELANKLKKQMFYPNYPKDKLVSIDELSDVLFHVQCMCGHLGISLEELSCICVEKQESRLV